MKYLCISIIFLLCFTKAFSGVFHFTEEDPLGTQVESLGNNVWRLTTDENYKVGGIWNNDDNLDIIDLTKNFCVTFRIQLSNRVNNAEGADGIAFVLYKLDPMKPRIGQDGGYLGFLNLPTAFGVEFDTFYNPDPNFSDPANDHIAYSYGGTIPQVLSSVEQITAGDNDSEDGSWIEVKIKWDATSQNLYTYTRKLNGTFSLRYSRLITDLISRLGSDKVNWGFFSSTHDKRNQHSVEMIAFNSSDCCDANGKLLVSKIGDKELIIGEDTDAGLFETIKICNGTSISLIPNVDPRYPLQKIEWYEKRYNEGSRRLIDEQMEANEKTFTPEVETDYSVVIKYQGECVNDDVIKIIPYNFNIAIDPDQHEICTGGINETIWPTYTITVNGSPYLLNTDESIQWQWSEEIESDRNPPIPTFIQGPNNQQNLILNSFNNIFTSATYRLKATLKAKFYNTDSFEYSTACESFASKKYVHTLQINATGPDLCVGGQAVTWKITTSSEVNFETFEWKDENGTVIGNTKSVQISAPGNYIVKASLSGCYAEQEFTVRVKNFDADIEVVNPLCNGSGLLKAKTYNGDAPYTYKWERDGATVGTEETLSITLPGSYTLTVKDAFGCEIVKTIVIDNPINSHLLVHPYYAVCQGASVKLESVIVGREMNPILLDGEHLYWYPTTGLDNAVDNFHPIATLDHDMVYTATFVSSQGCVQTKQCSVKVMKSNTEYVKLISPRGVIIQSIYYLFNNLQETARYTYQNTDLPCGYMVSGFFDKGLNLDPVIGNPPPGFTRFPYITAFDGDGNIVKTEIYKENTIPEPFTNFEYNSLLNISKNTPPNPFGYKELTTVLGVGSYPVSDNVATNCDILVSLLNKDLTPISGQTKKFGLANRREVAIKALQDKNENIYVLGKDLGAVNGLETNDIILIKLNTSLNPLWTKKYSVNGTSNDDKPFDMVLDANDDVIIIGSSRNDYYVNPMSIILRIDKTNGNIASSKAYTITGEGSKSMKIIPKGNNFIVLGEASTTSNVKTQLFELDENLNQVNQSAFTLHNNGQNDIRFGSANMDADNTLTLTLDMSASTQQYVNWNTSTKDITKQFNYTVVPTDLPLLSNKTPWISSKEELKSYNRYGIAQIGSIEMKNNYSDPKSTFDGTWGLFIKTNKYTASNTLKQNNPSCFGTGNIVSSQITLLPNALVTFATSSLNINTPVSILSSTEEVFTTSELCTTAPICNCDSNIINVDVQQLETSDDPDQCCYTFQFTAVSLASSCNIRKVKIDDQTFDLSANDIQNGFTYPSTPIKICFSTFTGRRTLTFTYLNANGDIICSTTKDIVCKCNCETEPINMEKVKLFIEPRNEESDRCCYGVFIYNAENDCSLKNGTFTFALPAGFTPSAQTHNMSPDWNGGWDNAIGAYVYTLKPTKQIPGKSVFQVLTLCVDRSDERKTFNFNFTHDNCSINIKEDLGCPDNCCDKISLLPVQNPSGSSEIECCYTFSVLIQPEEGCGGVSQIVITNEFGTPLWHTEPGYAFSSGINTITYCIPKSAMGGASLFPIKFKFYNASGDLICEKDATIAPCDSLTEPKPTPCNPDGDPNSWIEAPEQTINIPCGGSSCLVSYNFFYRMITLPDGKIYRDIQVTSYTVDPNCECKDYVIPNILESILNNNDVKGEFQIDQNFYNSTTKCFDNFRLITSDCWTYPQLGLNPPIYKCENSICCYAIYRVCYDKDAEGHITLSSTNKPVKTENYYTPQSCPVEPTYLCRPYNCGIWFPDVIDKHTPWNVKITPPASGAKIGLEENESEQVVIEECVVKQNGNDNFFTLSLEDKVKGEVTVQFYSIIGELAAEYKFNKDQIHFDATMEPKLYNGSYVCHVKLNDQKICVKKVIIVK